MGVHVAYSFGVFKVFNQDDFPVELHNVFCTDCCEYGEKGWTGGHDLQWNEKELKASAEKAFGEGSKIRARINGYTDEIAVICELSYAEDGLYWDRNPYIRFLDGDGCIAHLTSLREELKKIGLIIGVEKCRLGVFDASS